MRGLAQFLGWGWIVFNGLVVLSFVINDPPSKWPTLFFVEAILTAPGLLLVLWGRGARKAPEQ